MTLIEIANIFKAATDLVTGLNGFSFGWASDRVRSQVYTDEGENSTNLFPRVFFQVPTLVNNPITRKDQYQVVIFFDDLLGYNEDGSPNDDTQLEKWSGLITFAEKFVLEINKNKTQINISENVNLILDSFTSMQRLVTVQASFTINVQSQC